MTFRLSPRRGADSITIKEPYELAIMRKAGRRLAEVVALVKEAVKVGVTTAELDALAEEAVLERDSQPAFKGYRVGHLVFPATLCTSINEQVVHGIPNQRRLEPGDILSVDVGLVFGGYYADMAFTAVAGEVTPEVAQFLEVTRESLYQGIALAVPGNRIGDIGHAVQSHVEPHGYGIIRDYVGHGIGRQLHEPPSIPNFGKPHRGSLIKAGMCFAIEPMTSLGHHRTKVLKDGWTVITADRSLAGHFEHTIAVTPRGPEILTVLEGGVSPA
ncbi:MAG: type I methionyl aminopeptidase [Deltaproteobacteria bacterium]|nr:type I methionyl aminopeptidase [Deltaproteobacteria bacterium]MBW2256439.1 type I methionyl aminopeptidase [Deltaproteobacteria bacterium]